MVGNLKIVHYDEWCPKCLHVALEEWKQPCHDCLNTPANYDTHKPINFRAKDEEGKAT